MSKLSIINANTITRRIRDYAVIGLVGFALCKLPPALNYMGEKISYNKRVSSVERYVEDNNFDSARALLEKFREDLTLKPADISELEVKIEDSKKRFDEEEKRKKEEAVAKEAKEKSDAKQPEKSREESELEKKLSAEPLIDFSSNKSLDDILFNVTGLFELTYYPPNILKNLDKFYDALKERKDFSASDERIFRLANSSSRYLIEISKDLDNSEGIGLSPYPTGTKMMVIKKGNISKYSWSNTPSDIQLGTIGEYVRDSSSADSFHLIRINNVDYWFSQDELMLYTPYFDSLQKLQKIRIRLRDIEDTIRDKQNRKDSIPERIETTNKTEK